MCCVPTNDFSYEDINGECPDCGADTVDGEAIDSCYWSSTDCNTCGYAPCNGSC